MKISYDPEIDALYIRLLEGKHECRSVRLSEEVALNISAGEKLVGLEILDARSVLGPGKTPAVILEGIESADAPLVAQEKPAKEYDAEIYAGHLYVAERGCCICSSDRKSARHCTALDWTAEPPRCLTSSDPPKDGFAVANL